jgi:hypothetical protein
MSREHPTVITTEEIPTFEHNSGLELSELRQDIGCRTPLVLVKLKFYAQIVRKKLYSLLLGDHFTFFTKVIFFFILVGFLT